MIKTPLSTVIGGAFWTPGCTVIGGQQSFSQLIKKLFSNGEQGFFYDPNDLSTMYQDAVGTIPVTEVGQPVGLIRDKSGRNNHAYQTTSASRPILRQNVTTGAYYLEFDGTDDFLQTAVSLPFPVTAVAPFDFKSKDVIKCILSAGNSGYLRSTETTASVFSSSGGSTVAKKKVDVLLHELTGDSVNIRSNSAAIAMRDTDSKNPYGPLQKYIGSFSDTHTTLRAAMDLYGMVVVRKLLSASEEAELRAHFNKRMGI
ncbi:MAG: hypothetical protein L0G96_01510 [Acinetobacter sp.]|nr:hypothetical protein [Acinetobacter sp.]